MKKRGMSGIVASILLIAIVMSLTSIVWVVVNNLVTENLNEAQTCFGVFEAVEINRAYTCYNSTSNETRIAISVKDKELDSVLISITANGNSESFNILNQSSEIQNVYSYPGKETLVQSPGANSGRTYLIDNIGAGIGPTDSIKIAPYINGKMCDNVDTLSRVPDCRALA